MQLWLSMRDKLTNADALTAHTYREGIILYLTDFAL